jgi:hypothetical protein
MLLENKIKEKEQLIMHQESRLVKVEESEFDLKRTNKDLTCQV